MDKVADVLLELKEALTAAWAAHQDEKCPLGELAALAAAAHTFYVERERPSEPPSPDGIYTRQTPARLSPAAAADHWTNYVKI